VIAQLALLVAVGAFLAILAAGAVLLAYVIGLGVWSLFKPREKG
jgi:hypothetical protein